MIKKYFSQNHGKIPITNDHDNINKALVTLAIEETLLGIGKGTYNKVIEQLGKTYNCYLPECYEHPQYINAILKDLYGNSHYKIVESIGKKLEEFSYRVPVKKFLQALNQ